MSLLLKNKKKVGGDRYVHYLHFFVVVMGIWVYAKVKTHHLSTLNMYNVLYVSDTSKKIFQKDIESKISSDD